MIQITLPDGSVRSAAASLSIGEFAASIGPGLAKAALAGKVDGRLVDLSHTIDRDVRIEIVTDKHPDALDIIRHSTAHLLAQATQRLFPKAQVTIGPVVDNGFYYDFAYERAFTPDDLAAIEREMEKIVREALPVRREVMEKNAAIALFRDKGEHFKAEIIDDIIPPGEDISLYAQGDWLDLCRGPHVPSTAKLGAFKLMKVAGAYWRGDARNQQLQRIYGTAWLNKKDLEAYLRMLEEAEKRDHRRIGKQLDLFHMQEEAPGLVFWHPKGWAMWQAIEQYMRRVYRDNGYQEVRGPQILDRTLWEKSGHWENFKDNMFTTASENRDYAVKPMNCPGHVQIYNHGLHSYRDLPLRYGEFGSCHRNESSGSLHGIMRVRGFTQDDGHIFCTEDQIQSEVADFIVLLRKVYRDFGFEEVLYKLSTRPEKRVGSDEIWDKAELALKTALEAQGIDYQLQPGEGAFYGPKIEFTLKDAIGRLWQVGTIQVDFSMPARLGAEYVGEDSARHTPVMLHRAILGSFERFIGILLENHAGALPVWLAPVQAVVMNITDAQADYVKAVNAELHAAGLRVQADVRNEKVGYKIREHTLQKVPYLLVAGDRERDGGLVSVRTRGGEDLGTMTPAALAAKLRAEYPAGTA
ncbi:MAG: threonine--tRNA ligase [Xanthomonadales bacterium]|nr:threonine--tRNA ligase [Xanthomonadales bacterium]